VKRTNANGARAAGRAGRLDAGPPQFFWRRARAGAKGAGGLFDLDDHLDFDDGPERKRGDAEGGARVFAAIAEDGDEKVGATVDDRGLGFEIVDGVDEAADANDAFNFTEIADFTFEGGKEGEGRGAGGGLSVLFRGVAADLAGDHFIVGIARDMAGEKDEVAGADRGHVIRDGGAGGGQGEAEGGDFGLWGVGDILGGQRGEGAEREGAGEGEVSGEGAEHHERTLSR
jgi:hypothetical protein